MSVIEHYAVFGHPISHSKSPRIHTLFAEQAKQAMTYTAQDVPADEFNTALRHFIKQGGKGLNCTVPLKELAWQQADRLSERAQLSKAVNTLAVQADGSLLGDNTDGIGLIRDLRQNHAVVLKNKHILILGAGGASRGIIAPLLAEFPAQVVIANRTVAKAQTLQQEFTHLGEVAGYGYDALVDYDFDLIINATSASLRGDLPPLPENLLRPNGDCYDLAYANQPTAFVQWGLTHQAHKSIDGLGMLVEQAAEAFFIWRGVRPQTQPVIDLLNAERQGQSLKT